MPVELRLSPIALSDLDEIWSTIAAFNVAAADSMLDRIDQRFEPCGAFLKGPR